MRIAYIVPGVGLSSREIERRSGIANKIASRASVDIVTVDRGPQTIEGFVEEAYASISYLPKLYMLKDRYDAFIIGCFGDPGLHASRELIDKPVIGPAEASLSIASMLGERFLIISPLKSTVALTYSIVRSLGYSDRVYKIVSIDRAVKEIAEGSYRNWENLGKSLRKHIDRGKGEVAILGCMSMGFALADEPLSRVLEVPVVNPVKVSIKIAEIFAELGLKHSRTTYPGVDIAKLKDLLNI